MNRNELAYAVFEFFKINGTIMLTDDEIWRAIACTDDMSLLMFYEGIVLEGGDLDG